MNSTKRIITALMLLAPQASLADIITDFEGHPLLANYDGLQLSSIENEATKFCTEFGYNRMENFQAILGDTPLDARVDTVLQEFGTFSLFRNLLGFHREHHEWLAKKLGPGHPASCTSKNFLIHKISFDVNLF